MHHRPIPRSGEMLPVIGLGTWRGFDIGRGRDERQARREILESLFAAGGAVIDSSPMYGRAEAVVGDLLDSMGARDRAFVATKVWTTGEHRGIDQMARSMALMRADPIDLIQIHNLVDLSTQLRTLQAWQEQGRVRYVGITHYTVSAFDELARIMRLETIDFVQLPLSIGMPQAEEHLLPLAADRGIAVLVNRPFEGGSLFRETRRRDLPALARELGCESWSQYFLNYVVSHPAVTCVIPGTGNPGRARDAFAAADGRLASAEERVRMRDDWTGA